MADDFVKTVRAAFPFPWTQQIFPNGIIRLIDATGKEVDLLCMTEFVCFLTNAMAKQKQEQPT